MTEAKVLIPAPRPLDNDSREMVVYGPWYPKVKAYEVEIGYELTIVYNRTRSLLAELDLNLANEIIREHPRAPYTDLRPSEIADFDVARLGDTLYVLRELARLEWARAWFIDRRERIRAYARLCGAVQHSAAITKKAEYWKESSKSIEQTHGPIGHPHSREW